MIQFIILLAIVAGAWWYLAWWPFDGSTAMPKRRPPGPIHSSSPKSGPET